jgi:hypothetical protein
MSGRPWAAAGDVMPIVAVAIRLPSAATFGHVLFASDGIDIGSGTLLTTRDFQWLGGP